MKKNSIKVKGMLIHMAHYAPDFLGRPEHFGCPFSVETGLRVIDAMAESGMNLLAIDVEDGVRYKSHPELTRDHSAPMKELKRLCEHARANGLDVVPKLNFAKSGRNQHDMWMAPYSHLARWIKDGPVEKYWDVADDVIAELVEECQPSAYFHVGMDEDHYRSLKQYVQAIKNLHKMVTRHGLKMLIWNDSCHDRIDKVAQVHAEKSRAAEELIPKDIIHVLWDYRASHPSVIKRVRERGFRVWGSPGREPDLIENWRRPLIKYGGEGLLMTRWVKCAKRHEKDLLSLVRTCGPLL